MAKWRVTHEVVEYDRRNEDCMSYLEEFPTFVCPECGYKSPVPWNVCPWCAESMEEVSNDNSET